LQAGEFLPANTTLVVERQKLLNQNSRLFLRLAASAGDFCPFWAEKGSIFLSTPSPALFLSIRPLKTEPRQPDVG
jgi:hypothetical protein